MRFELQQSIDYTMAYLIQDIRSLKITQYGTNADKPFLKSVSLEAIDNKGFPVRRCIRWDECKNQMMKLLQDKARAYRKLDDNYNQISEGIRDIVQSLAQHPEDWELTRADGRSKFHYTLEHKPSGIEFVSSLVNGKVQKLDDPSINMTADEYKMLLYFMNRTAAWCTEKQAADKAAEKERERDDETKRVFAAFKRG